MNYLKEYNNNCLVIKKIFPELIIKAFAVFANQNIGGNPCIIVNNCQNLTTKTMQLIATTLNFPETVFILPETNKDISNSNNQYYLRFFAPKNEIELCCHGALGSAYYLWKLNENFTLKTYKEKIEISINFSKSNNITSISMLNKIKILKYQVSTLEITKFLNISSNEIIKYLPCIIATIGSPKLLVPVINKKILFNLKPNLSLIAEWSNIHQINGIYCYTNDTNSVIANYQTRNFNPKFSDTEDIATGSAAATLISMLYLKKVINKGEYLIEQGFNLNYGSNIIITINNDLITIKGQIYEIIIS